MDGIEAKLAQARLELASSLRSTLNKLPQHGELSLHWPAQPAIGAHLTWSPGGLRGRRTIAIASSRLGRRLDREDDIFRFLRAACRQLDPQQQVLITTAGTTLHRFLCRAAELWRIPLRDVILAPGGQSLTAWVASLDRSVGEATAATARSPLYVSPPLPPLATRNAAAATQLASPRRSAGRPATQQNACPWRDRFLVHASDQLLVLSARNRGNIYRLVLERLARRGPGSTFLALGSERLVGAAVADTLMRRGAAGWHVPGGRAGKSPPQCRSVACPPGAAAAAIRIGIRDGPYLTHCTRSIAGPWPDQAEADFLDDLLLGRPRRDRSPLASLSRLIQQRRILATSKAIRGGVPVVSFTAVPPTRLKRLRRFRSHRGRWDFEPYGICIGRDLMIALGARPVCYGDDATWQAMPAEQRPFFQQRVTRDGRIDWRVEHEWRLMGDLELARVPHSEAIVFVPSQAEADYLASFSHWPVAVLAAPKTVRKKLP